MKYMFLATEDNKMQLMHILLNANHFHDSGHKVAVVLECASPSLLIGIEDGSIKLPLFNKAMENGIIDHACKACTAQFSGVPIMGELQGHSNLLRFVEEGYSIIRF
jgi:hypothetical protein